MVEWFESLYVTMEIQVQILAKLWYICTIKKCAPNFLHIIKFMVKTKPVYYLLPLKSFLNLCKETHKAKLFMSHN